MRALWRVCIAGVPLLFGLVLLPGSVASAAPAQPQHGYLTGDTYHCPGGTIPPGGYGALVVTGVCYAKAGNVFVSGNVTVAPHALFDTISKGDPAASPVVPATVDIGGSVFVGSGAVFLFGCSPNITCTTPPAISYDHINGNLTALGAQAVVIHSATIGGNVTISGGGGGAAAVTCNAQLPTEKTPVPTLEPWSEDPTLYYTPVYTDTEDATIGGNYTVTGLTSCWLGTIRNEIGGNVNISNNTMGDPDATEIGNNLVAGNMTCIGDSPAPQFGDSGSAPDIVRGSGVGGCAFQATAPNPAPHHTTTTNTTVRAGIREHIAVRASTLQTFTGRYTFTPAAELPIGTTESGNSIVAVLGNFAISGPGLSGRGNFNPTEPPGHSGAAVLESNSANGTDTYLVYLNCQCRFGGQSGMVTIRAYGSSSAGGLSSGTFLVTSGGGYRSNDLSTLAGWGTFTNRGNPTGPIWLTEHLVIS